MVIKFSMASFRCTIDKKLQKGGETKNIRNVKYVLTMEVTCIFFIFFLYLFLYMIALCEPVRNCKLIEHFWG